MNTKTRTGKIARLAAPIREQLNTRLNNGESGPKLVAWLNALPETRELLQAEYEGRPISEQNLSEWRNGGYAEWLARREMSQQAAAFAAQAATLAPAAITTDALFQNLIALYAVAMQSWSPAEMNPAHAFIDSLKPLLKDVLAIRKSEQNALRLALEREKLEFRKSASHQQSAPVTSPSVTQPSSVSSQNTRVPSPVPAPPASVQKAPSAGPFKDIALFQSRNGGFREKSIPLEGPVRPESNLAQIFADNAFSHTGAI